MASHEAHATSGYYPALDSVALGSVLWPCIQLVILHSEDVLIDYNGTVTARQVHVVIGLLCL